MLKKLFKVGMLACAMLLSCSAFAQEDNEFAQCGFWSNWSLGAEGMVGWQSAAQTDGAWGFGAGFNVIAQKQLSNHWATRITAGVPRIWSKDTMSDGTKDNDNFGALTFGFVYSLANQCVYAPERKWDVYAFFDGGMTFQLDMPHYGRNALYADLGLGFRYRICDKSSLFLEGSISNCADIPNPVNMFSDGLKQGQVNAFVAFGYMYHFGLTAVDAELLAQKKKLTQENFDALNNQINALENEVATSKKAEQRLENRIAELENQANDYAKVNKNAAADSLQNVINQIKDDQMMYYALPFSILYGVDEWTIPADQEVKMKAIAKVMKDNPDVKFNLVGFCDYTGSDAYNMKLSQKRAEEVKKQLVKKYGIDEDRLTCDWKGKSVAYGDLKLSVNRRVSFYRVIE